MRDDDVRFLCLGYRDNATWQALPVAERAALDQASLAFDDELRRRGCLLAGAICAGEDVVTVRSRNARIDIGAATFADPGVSLVGYLIVEARDLNHAIALVSRHPCVKAGGFEIRPAVPLN